MTWQGYLSGFHQRRAGITERVLGRCVDRDGATPYDWLGEMFDSTTSSGDAAAAAASTATVLDLACGSGPLWRALSGHRYVGVDRSAAELALAAERGAGPLVRADAAALPIAGRTMWQVVCAMALMLLEPLSQVLAEVRRVLLPEGRLVAIVPTGQPLAARDAAVVAGLLATVGRLRYPNDAVLADASGLCATAGLRLIDDQRRRFVYRLAGRDDADALLDSLYLPGVSRRRIDAARRYLRALARIHAAVPVPIRRLVAVPHHRPA